MSLLNLDTHDTDEDKVSRDFFDAAIADRDMYRKMCKEMYAILKKIENAVGHELAPHSLFCNYQVPIEVRKTCNCGINDVLSFLKDHPSIL